ncbi:calcium/sodium antiporter, partial [Desulfobacula sp.]|uniref:calcium/sodium antiporter n=1 Tax=Desulfobacula sp. TaxID=2593537 RepID=UPI0039B95915
LLIQIIILILGLLMLGFGSTLLVVGAASTAIMFAVRPVIVGLTIVSFATSAPELLVSLVAAFKGSGGISIGNILGSNVINIALVLGISAVIRPVVIKKQIITIEIPYMFFISFIFWMLCLDLHIGRIDGIVLISLLIIFLIYSVATAKDKNSRAASEIPTFFKISKNFFFIIIGIVMLSYGANLVVQEAIIMAEKIGLSQTFIGISIVALGTSLPELATSAVAAAKGESDISVGNVVGSNLFNICLVMGVVGLFNPMQIDKTLHYFQFPFMMFICFILGLIAYFNKGIGKRTGYFFITLFIIYILISYLKS